VRLFIGGRNCIDANTGGTQRKPLRTDVIVVGIEIDDEEIGRVRRLVVAREQRANLRRVALEHARADINILIVVENAHFSALARRLTFSRVLLTEVPDRRRAPPFGFLERAVDRRRMRGACRHGQRTVQTVLVRETRAGLVLYSTDAGATWTDLTPYDLVDLPSVQLCHVFDDGRVALAGALGSFAVYRPN